MVVVVEMVCLPLGVVVVVVVMAVTREEMAVGEGRFSGK